MQAAFTRFTCPTSLSENDEWPSGATGITPESHSLYLYYNEIFPNFQKGIFKNFPATRLRLLLQRPLQKHDADHGDDGSGHQSHQEHGRVLDDTDDKESAVGRP